MSLHGQDVKPKAAFEVASIKPSGPAVVGSYTSLKGGPGSADPSQISYSRVALKQMILLAYSIKDYQLFGPDWLETERYDVKATIPPNTSKDQFVEMLQSMLEERFGLVVHRESRQVSIYQLIVAKNGPKLTRCELPSHAPAPAPPPAADDFPALPPGDGPAMRGSLRNGRNRVIARMMTMQSLAGFLENQVGRPVVDKTGLSGGYDIRLDFSTAGLGGQIYLIFAQAAAEKRVQGLPPEQDDGGPTLFAALEQQFGLKMQPAKAAFSVVVVDRINRVTTGN
jgi:uncharacterized protein (TIGR03435 family)